MDFYERDSGAIGGFMFFSVWTFDGTLADYRCIGIYSDEGAAKEYAANHPDVIRLNRNGKPLPVIRHASIEVLIDYLLQKKYGELVNAVRGLASERRGHETDDPKDPKVKRLWGHSLFPLAIFRAK